MVRLRTSQVLSIPWTKTRRDSPSPSPSSVVRRPSSWTSTRSRRLSLPDLKRLPRGPFCLADVGLEEVLRAGEGKVCGEAQHEHGEGEPEENPEAFGQDTEDVGEFGAVAHVLAVYQVEGG